MKQFLNKALCWSIGHDWRSVNNVKRRCNKCRRVEVKARYNSDKWITEEKQR